MVGICRILLGFFDQGGNSCLGRGAALGEAGKPKPYLPQGHRAIYPIDGDFGIASPNTHARFHTAVTGFWKVERACFEDGL